MYQIKENRPEIFHRNAWKFINAILNNFVGLSNLSDRIFLVKMLLCRITFHLKFRSKFLLTNRIQSYVNKKFKNFNQMS